MLCSVHQIQPKKDVVMNISILLHLLLFFLSQLWWSQHRHCTSGIYRHSPVCPAAQTVVECSQVGASDENLGSALHHKHFIPHWIARTQNAEARGKYYTFQRVWSQSSETTVTVERPHWSGWTHNATVRLWHGEKMQAHTDCPCVTASRCWPVNSGDL